MQHKGNLVWDWVKLLSFRVEWRWSILKPLDRSSELTGVRMTELFQITWDPKVALKVTQSCSERICAHLTSPSEITGRCSGEVMWLRLSSWTCGVTWWGISGAQPEIWPWVSLTCSSELSEGWILWFLWEFYLSVRRLLLHRTGV